MKLSVVDNRTRLAERAVDPAVARLREEMVEQSAAFETAPAGLILAWAVERFGPKLALSCSFQEAVLIDLAVAVDPDIEVVFLDTGSHFEETLEYVEAVRARYDLNLTVAHPAPGAEEHPCGTSQCCEYRKVRPLRSALVGKGRLGDRSQAGRRPHPPARADRGLRRQLGHGEDQPARHLDAPGHRGLRSRPWHSPAPPALPGVRVHRLCPHRPARWPRGSMSVRAGGPTRTRSSAGSTSDMSGR